MAAMSAPRTSTGDQRFNYEPLLGTHQNTAVPIDFLGKEIKQSLWISSMTGGSEAANKINKLLAEACAEFGLGMGLGSCRTLLESDEFFDDFNLRPVIGNDLPFYANLGIAQIEKILQTKEGNRIHDLVDKLGADGLFIHVNPTQEWLQPEGDMFTRPAIETISELIDLVNNKYKLFVKEVGQGFGPKSLEKLFKLKIDGLEFGAFGGTNFASIEIMRNQQGHTDFMYPLATFGHNAYEMVEMINKIVTKNQVYCKQIIVSGGIKNFLDGYYLTQKSSLPAVYGMAGVILRHAISSRKDLFDFIKAEIEGFKYAKNFLEIRQ